MGLLGDSWDDPTTMATLNLAAGLLGGRTLGQGLSNGLQGYQSSLEASTKQKLANMQLAQAQRQADMINTVWSRLQGQQQAPTQNDAGTQALALGAQNGSVGPTNANAQAMNTIQSSGLPQSQTRQPFSLDDLTMMSVAGMPGAKELLDIYKYRNNPIAMPSGQYYRDPNTGKMTYMADPSKGVTLDGNGNVVAMPGAADALASVEGAKTKAQEGAKDTFAIPQPVDLPGNKRQALTPSQQRAMANGGVDPATGYTLPGSVGSIISNVAGGASLDALLPAVIQAESGGNQNAVSPKGAIGKGQLMPKTAAGLGVNPNDPVENVAGSAAMLSQLRKKYGDDRIALAAYNWGPGNVDLWLKSGGDWSKLPRETQNYVGNVLKSAGQGQGTSAPQVGIPLATEADKKVDAASADASVNAAKVKTNADALLANIQQARALVKQLPYGVTAPASEWWNNQQWGNPDTAAAIAKWHNIMGNFTLQGIASSGLGRMDIPIVNAINAASQVDMGASPAAKMAALDQIETNLRNHVAASTNVVPELNKPGVNTSTSTQPMTGSGNSTAARTVSLSDIAATAKASGKSTAQVTADIRAKGWKIAGDK